MARIPIERRDRGGAWWWVLVVAVIGLVVWLVYEWFDNDYYEDYRYSTNETRDEVVPQQDRTTVVVPGPTVVVPGADQDRAFERGYERGAASAGTTGPTGTTGATGATGTTPMPSTGCPGLIDQGELGGVAGSAGVLTSLDPLATSPGWRSYVDRPVQVDHLRVDRVQGDRAFTIDVRGEPILVVGDRTDLQGLRPGAVVDIDQGRVVPLDDPDELRGLGVDPATFGREPFYIRADDVSVTG